MRCEKCGHEQNFLPILICHKLVGRSRSKGITSLSKKLAKEQRERLQSFKEIRTMIFSLEDGKVFTTQQFLRMLGWSARSNGDLARVMLDWNVCLGNLRKLEFNKGRKGHVYRREDVGRCEFLERHDKEYGYFDKCNFSFKQEDGASIIKQVHRDD